MPQDSIADSLRQFGQRVKGVFNSSPKAKPEPTNEEKRKLTEKAVGPRFRITPRQVKPSPVTPKRKGKIAKKGLRKY